MSYNISELANDQMYSGSSLFDNIDLSNKDPKSFTKQLKNNIKLLSTSAINKGTIFGSFNYKASLYPGDVDLRQDIKYKGSKNIVIKKFYNAYIKTIKDIYNTVNHYVGETKAGLDLRFMLDIGYLSNGQIINFNSKVIKKQISLLFNNNLLTEHEFDKITYLIKNITVDNHDEFKEILRNLFTLRWSYEEVLNNKKVLRGGQTKLFTEALLDKTLIKFDIHLLLAGKYIEMSNHFILIQIHKDGSEEFVNLPQNFVTNLNENLKYEVEKLYYNKQFFNLIKFCKRIFSIARLDHNITGQDNTPNLMLKLLNSDAGILYQIKSDLDTIITMIRYIKKPPIVELMNQLDNTKLRMSNITEIDIDSDTYYKKVNYIVSHYKTLKRETMITILSGIKDNITDILNKFTFTYLQSINFIPPPREFLPINLKYEY